MTEERLPKLLDLNEAWRRSDLSLGDLVQAFSDHGAMGQERKAVILLTLSIWSHKDLLMLASIAVDRLVAEANFER